MNTMTPTRRLPQRNGIYTTAEVCKELSLSDAPFFMVCVRGMSVALPVQTSHLTDDELLSVPGWVDSKWRYSHTTDEWCPIFHWVEGDPADVVDVTDDLDSDEPLVTPKGHPWR